MSFTDWCSASKLARASRKYLNLRKDGRSLGNCPHPEDLEVMHGSALLQLRARVWVLLQDPDSSIWSYRLSMLFLLTVFLSTLVLCVSTMPAIASACCCASAPAMVTGLMAPDSVNGVMTLHWPCSAKARCRR